MWVYVNRPRESRGDSVRIITLAASNRPIDDWSKLLGNVVVVAPLLDRVIHLLKFEGKNWRLKEAEVTPANGTDLA